MTIDLYDDKYKPVVKFSTTTYLVRLPDPAAVASEDAIYIYVEVDQYGQASIDPRSFWNGGRINQIDSHSRDYWALQREVIDYLVEWELLKWVDIGPDDKEIFATDNLLETKLELDA